MARVNFEASSGLKKELSNKLSAAQFTSPDFFITTALGITKDKDINSYIIISVDQVGLEVESYEGDFTISNMIFSGGGKLEKYAGAINSLFDDLAVINIYRKTYRLISSTFQQAAKKLYSPDKALEKIHEVILTAAINNDCKDEAEKIYDSYEEVILEFLNKLVVEKYDEYAIHVA